VRIDSGRSTARGELFVYAGVKRTSPPRDGESVSPYQRTSLGGALNSAARRPSSSFPDYLAGVLEARVARLGAAR
jgi:hypothetical protein